MHQVLEQMHKVLEYYYNNEKYFNATDFELPRKMAEIIKENLKITEVWGNEVSLAYNQEYEDNRFSCSSRRKANDC